MSTPISYRHASLVRRLFAALLDGVLIGLFGSVLFVGAYLASNGGTDPSGEGVAFVIFFSFPALFLTEIFGFPGAVTEAMLLLIFCWFEPTSLIFFCLLPLLISSTYHGLMESLPTKATLGKLAMGIFVSDLNGNKISFMRAMSRYLAIGCIILEGLSTLTRGRGYLMGIGKTGQAWHDELTGCIVLSKE